jgi:hypothetical protein
MVWGLVLGYNIFAMFKSLWLVVGLIGALILTVVFWEKLPEIKSLSETTEVQKTVPRNITSSEIAPEEKVSKLIVRRDILPPKIDIPSIAAVLPKVPESALPQPPAAVVATAATTSISEIETPPPAPKLPPLDEERLLTAVVKIQCPTTDGLGKYIGSGFVVGEHTVVTAAHVIKDSASDTCEVIFPRERKPIHYLRGMIINLKETMRRHDEEGIDVGILTLPELSSYPEARAIFSAYPSIFYPLCGDSQMLGDKLLHFGYPSNFLDQTYLSKQEGEATVNAKIEGVENRVSLDGTYTYKSPIFGFTYDESKMYPYMVSRVASFYGDSGGLAFNADKQCIIGPHRGGTIGKAAGENYSVFMNLGWEKIQSFWP